MDSQNKNTILAIALSVLVLIAWQFLYVSPKLDAERKAAELEAQRQQVEQSQSPSGGTTTSQATGTEGTSGAGDLPNAGTSADIPVANPSNGAVPGVAATTREAAIANSPRISFENDRITGSINLKAGRIDDLRLKDYHLTIDKTSPLVTLLSPSETADGYFAEFGFVGSAASGDVPGPETEWQVAGNDKLTPGNPVVLEWRNSKNVIFRRTISLDDIFLFSIEDSIENSSSDAISLSPYARVTRFGTPQTANIFVLHEGLIGVFGEDGLQEVDYSDVKDDKQILSENHERGWLGITDKYWATALIPNGSFKPRFAYFDSGRERYQADYLGDALTINAGGSAQVGHRFFGGAKITQVVDTYQDSEDIESFDLMIDWGWFYFITKPLFQLMNWLFKMVGNFGVAILITTVLIKAALFPLANMSYASMAKMKKVQPDMQRIKEEAGDDRVKDAAGNDGALQAREDQPGCRLLADPHPDSDLLRTLQGHLCDHRDAPCAFLRLDPGSFGARPDLYLQPVRPAALRGARTAPDRRLAADHGHYHVPADADEPDAARSDPADDLQMDADRLHLHAGDLPGRPGDLLGVEQLPVDHPAGR